MPQPPQQPRQQAAPPLLQRPQHVPPGHILAWLHPDVFKDLHGHYGDTHAIFPHPLPSIKPGGVQQTPPRTPPTMKPPGGPRQMPPGMTPPPAQRQPREMPPRPNNGSAIP